MSPTWIQNYNPLGSAVLSTLVAAVPVSLLFYLLAIRRTAAWRAALGGFGAALLIALAVFRMPPVMAVGALAHGLVFGVIRVVLTLVGAVFIYELAVASGRFKVIMESIGALSDNRRLQVLLVAFAFGALLEGSGGGGAPVAVSGAMLVGLGFKPLDAAVLGLIANTVPVAWGAMGTPILTLQAVTGLPQAGLNAMVGRILPVAALILPAWLAWAQAGTRAAFEVWPGLVAAGASFAAIQFVWSNYVDSVLVAVAAGLGTLLVLALFLRVWQPASVWRYPGDQPVSAAARHSVGELLRAWSPFLLLVAFVVVWGLPPVKRVLDLATWQVPVPGLHLCVLRQPPVVASPQAEPAVFDFAWLSSVSTAALLTGLVAGPVLGLSLTRTWELLLQTFYRLRFSLIAILGMLGLGFITRYSGMDAVLGLALTNTGRLFPFFGALIGWIGVLLTGTNAGSNALFGSLQAITARNLGLKPVLMAAANAAGGVMGKMINAQSIIVGCAATGLEGREGDVFRAVLKHSLALAVYIGLVVLVYAYWLPELVPDGG